jgi:tetratricopeptide (TPR) repeat protein
LLAACSSEHRAPAFGTLIFDQTVMLERGERRDVARHEITVDGKATFVAIAEEDDLGLVLRMSHIGVQGTPAAKVEVDSRLSEEGIEIATLDAPPGTRLTVELESAPDFERPGKARLRILRFDGELAASPRAAARLAAFRAWSAATSTNVANEDWLGPAIRNIDLALSHFESADGDPLLAAWGRMARGRLNNRQGVNLTTTISDARIAARGFEALGATRNASRARKLEASTLLDIASVSTARNPSAEEAAHLAEELLTAISVDPAISAYERASALQFLGFHDYYVINNAGARKNWQAAKSAFEAIGERGSRRAVVQNLAAIAYDEGDFRAAAKQWDSLITELDQISSPELRMALLHNAATVDTSIGNVELAIERLLQLLELTREHKVRPFEAHALFALGNAYLVRGDVAQATAFHVEALKLRRTVEDSYFLMLSLQANGSLVRAAGDLPGALRLHREALALATTPGTRVSSLLELARDYTAASNFQRAITTCREALAVPLGAQRLHWAAWVRLALAEALLRQPRRTPAAVSEAATLSRDALGAAINRGDPGMEIAARRMLAQSHTARADFAGARVEYERAIDLIFKYRSAINNPELQASTAADEQQVYRGYVDLLMRDVARRGPGKLLPVNSSEENALRTLEWARAINFDAARVSSLDANTQSRVDELLARMAGKRIRMASLADRSADSTRELALLQLDIAKLRTEVDGLRATAVRDPKAAGTSPTLDAPWPAMPAGITQLSYALETEHVYLWVRDASGIRATVLAATPAVIDRELTTLGAAIRKRDPQQLDVLLAHLSTVLLPAGALRDDAKTLEIVAEGRIAGIPFAGLILPGEPARRLVEGRSIEMIGTLFEERARPRPKQAHALGFVALANEARPGADASASRVFSVLHTVNAEARDIEALFLRRDPEAKVRLLRGAEGSASNLRKAMQDGADVIHFATHGLSDPRQPQASLLLLPALDAAGSPTYLTAGQVQEWRGDVELVFLSACETAIGPSRFAEGLPGMQRAFLRAGSRAVIATLWPVEDIYASEFAADFYRRYFGGMRASQALSETQRAWIAPVAGLSAREQSYRRMTAWAHAIYSE